VARGFALGVLKNVPVDVHGDVDRGVAEDHRHDAGATPAAVRRVAVLWRASWRRRTRRPRNRRRG
jgi:hypothetical protein